MEEFMAIDMWPGKVGDSAVIEIQYFKAYHYAIAGKDLYDCDVTSARHRKKLQHATLLSFQQPRLIND